ncbi:MAG: LptF/LptG family permease [Verrucomicrobia bacterium]|nr:LptF/LptG family permease [Verrucomicrobiota bacterium]
MKIIDRYIFSSFMMPLSYCMIGFSLLFVIWDLFDHLNKFLASETTPLVIALYYVCLLLPTFEYLAPASLLLASLYTLWNFTRNNELTAMRASGISLYRIMVPLLATSIAFSLLAFVIKETLSTRAFEWTETLKQNDYQQRRKTGTRVLTHYNVSTRRLWRIDAFNTETPNILQGLKITQERPDSSRVRDYIADRAEWLDGAWWLFDVWEQPYDANDNPIGELTPMTPGDTVLKELRMFTEAPKEFQNEAKPWMFLSTLEMIEYLHHHPNLDSKNHADKLFDIHQRLAMPWACFIVTLFGIPAGTRSARQGVLIGIFLAMSFFFGFYALSNIGSFLGRKQIIDPWLGAWLSNIVFFITGSAMLARLR